MSVVYSLFDLLGFTAPYIMTAKLLLRGLNRKETGWDEPVADTERLQWKRWISDPGILRDVRIDRCLKPKGCDTVQITQLHLLPGAQAFQLQRTSV